MITHAAILKDGIVYTGRRHCFIIRDIPKHLRVGIKSEQGFLTDEGMFLNREMGAIHALACGQIVKLKYNAYDLFSEDLW